MRGSTMQDIWSRHNMCRSDWPLNLVKSMRSHHKHVDVDWKFLPLRARRSEIQVTIGWAVRVVAGMKGCVQ